MAVVGSLPMSVTFMLNNKNNTDTKLINPSTTLQRLTCLRENKTLFTITFLLSFYFKCNHLLLTNLLAGSQLLRTIRHKISKNELVFRKIKELYNDTLD